MGASKTLQYTENELNIANMAKALAHPARIRILTILKNEEYCRNIDITGRIGLVKSSVNEHLYKLKNVGFIRMEFVPNCYHVFLNESVYDSWKEVLNIYNEEI